MGNDELYTNIRLALAKLPDVVVAYLLGSYGEGRAGTESDFDLAVVVKNKNLTTGDTVYEKLASLSLPKDLDLSVVDKQSSPLFLFQIVSKGKRIYERSRLESVRFEAFVLHNYYDTQHLRNIYYSYLKRKFPAHSL